MNAKTWNSILLCLVLVILSLSVILTAQWLSPSVFDLKLEYEAILPGGILHWPKDVLDNYHPQLGKVTFYLSGQIGRLLGYYGSLGLRYVLFMVGLASFYLVYRKRFNRTDPLIFFLVIGTTFFFQFKYFFWVDYLLVLPLTMLLIILLQRRASSIAIFLLCSLILYLKLSSLHIILLFIAVFADWEEIWEKRRGLLTSMGASVLLFFLRWGTEPLQDRISYAMKAKETIFLFSINFLTHPWLSFEVFDMGEQKFITSWDVLTWVKLLLLGLVLVTLMRKKKASTSLKLLALIFSLSFTILMVRSAPVLHDISSYLGIIGLGLCGVIWEYFYSLPAERRKVATAVLVLLFCMDMGSWYKSYEKLDVRNGKGEMVSLFQDSEKSKIHFFCSENVGEFELFLKKEIAYSIKGEIKEPAFYANSLIVTPEECQHEQLSPDTKSKVASLVQELQKESRAHLIKTFQFDKDQKYLVYAVD